MRIAALHDIHGNLPALEAGLAMPVEFMAREAVRWVAEQGACDARIFFSQSARTNQRLVRFLLLTTAGMCVSFSVPHSCREQSWRQNA